MFAALEDDDDEESSSEAASTALASSPRGGAVEGRLSAQGLDEAEALSSIYGEDFERRGLTFAVKVRPTHWPSNVAAPLVLLTLKVAKEYPSSAVEFIDVDVLEGRVPGSALAQLRKTLRAKADELEGQEAVHELATTTAEALESLATSAMDLRARMLERERVQSVRDEEDRRREDHQRSLQAEAKRKAAADALKSQVERRDREALAETIRDNDNDGNNNQEEEEDLDRREADASRYAADFKELKLLGRGGFGDVAHCVNRLDRKEYAVKRVRLPRGFRRTEARRQLREVEALASVFHPHVVRYYQSWIEEAKDDDDDDDDRGESSGIFSDGDSSSSSSSSEATTTARARRDGGLELYIQMEYCETTLRDLIDRRTLVGRREDAWRLLRQILEALAYLHGPCGMVHRDLKPANVFVSGGNVKVGDLGLATTAQSTVGDDNGGVFVDHRGGTIVSSMENENTSQSQTIGVGTALYRAPEVSGSHYNSAADMFSLGVVFFEMLSPPFATGMERVDTLGAVRREKPPFPFASEKSEEGDSDDVHAGRNLVRRLVSHDPAKRPTAAALLEGKEPTLLPPSADILDSMEGPLLARAEATIRDPFSKARRRLVDAIFDAPSTELIEFTYGRKEDNGDPGGGTGGGNKQQQLLQKRPFVVAANAKQQQQQRGTLKDQLAALKQWEQDLRAAFELRGAVPFAAPLLRPRPRDQEGNLVELVDSGGAVVVLPTELTTPFARYVAGRRRLFEEGVVANTWRRYEFGRTFHDGGAKEKAEAAYDVVSPENLRTVEAECLRLAFVVAAASRKNNKNDVVVGHADLAAAVEALREGDADFCARIDGIVTKKKKGDLAAVTAALDRIRRSDDAILDRSRRRAKAALAELGDVLETADLLHEVIVDVDGKWRARRRKVLAPFGNVGVYFGVVGAATSLRSEASSFQTPAVVGRRRSPSEDSTDVDDDLAVETVGGRYGIERFVAPGERVDSAKLPRCVGVRFFPTAFSGGDNAAGSASSSTPNKKNKAAKKKVSSSSSSQASGLTSSSSSARVAAVVCGDGSDAGDEVSFRLATKLQGLGCVAEHLPRSGRSRPLRKADDDALAAEVCKDRALVLLGGDDRAVVRFQGKRADLPLKGLERTFADGALLRTALQQKKGATTTNNASAATSSSSKNQSGAGALRFRFVDCSAAGGTNATSSSGGGKRSSSTSSSSGVNAASGGSSLLRKRAAQALRAALGTAVVFAEGADDGDHNNPCLLAVDASLGAVRRINSAWLANQSVANPPKSALRTYVDHLQDEAPKARSGLWVFCGGPAGGLDFVSPGTFDGSPFFSSSSSFGGPDEDP